MAVTDLSNRISILRDFYLGYKDSPEFEDLFYLNDLGFPLAHSVFHKHAILTDEGKNIINDTWEAFLEYLDVEDTGFEDIGEIYYVG